MQVILSTQLIDLLIILSLYLFAWMYTYQLSFVYHNTHSKNPRLDRKNSENYRAIALSSVFGNFFDKIIIEKQVEQLGTSELQFGYKTKRSTVMCSTTLTETIEYYVIKNNSSICFSCLEGF